MANRRLGALAPNNALDVAEVPRTQLEKTREVQLIGHRLSKEHWRNSAETGKRRVFAEKSGPPGAGAPWEALVILAKGQHYSFSLGMGAPIPQRDPKPVVTELERRAHVASGRGTRENSVCLRGEVHTSQWKSTRCCGQPQREGFTLGTDRWKACAMACAPG